MWQEVFRSGRLAMSGSPATDLAGDAVWGDLLTNRILAVVAVVLLILGLSDLLRLTPHLLYSFDRSRGSADLEHSLGTARTRNLTALFFFLPFCLLLDRYALVRPRFWAAIPAQWSAPATLGLLVAWLLVRALCFALFHPRRLGSEQTATLKHLPYNYFILLAALTLITAGVCTVFRVPDGVVRTLLYWETGVIWLFTLVRSGQFLGANGMGFTTFLYLCGLEIIPAALMVAVVMFF